MVQKIAKDQSIIYTVTVFPERYVLKWFLIFYWMCSPYFYLPHKMFVRMTLRRSRTNEMYCYWVIKLYYLCPRWHSGGSDEEGMTRPFVPFCRSKNSFQWYPLLILLYWIYKHIHRFDTAMLKGSPELHWYKLSRSRTYWKYSVWQNGGKIRWG